jgi:hypothetical protein
MIRLPSSEVQPPDAASYCQLDILGENVNIQWYPESLMNGNYGSCHTEEREIRIRNDLNGQQCLDTFLHEINHYISEKCNIELTEHQVHMLGMSWASIFQSNPELLGFIAERTSEEDERRTK